MSEEKTFTVWTEREWRGRLVSCQIVTDDLETEADQDGFCEAVHAALDMLVRVR